IGNVQRGGVDRTVGDQLVEFDDSLLVVGVSVTTAPPTPLKCPVSWTVPGFTNGVVRLPRALVGLASLVSFGVPGVVGPFELWGGLVRNLAATAERNEFQGWLGRSPAPFRAWILGDRGLVEVVDAAGSGQFVDVVGDAPQDGHDTGQVRGDLDPPGPCRADNCGSSRSWITP